MSYDIFCWPPPTLHKSLHKCVGTQPSQTNTLKAHEVQSWRVYYPIHCMAAACCAHNLRRDPSNQKVESQPFATPTLATPKRATPKHTKARPLSNMKKEGTATGMQRLLTKSPIFSSVLGKSLASPKPRGMHQQALPFRKLYQHRPQTSTGCASKGRTHAR